jgi:hypothetical protein
LMLTDPIKFYQYFQIAHEQLMTQKGKKETKGKKNEEFKKDESKKKEEDTKKK